MQRIRFSIYYNGNPFLSKMLLPSENLKSFREFMKNKIPDSFCFSIKGLPVDEDDEEYTKINEIIEDGDKIFVISKKTCERPKNSKVSKNNEIKDEKEF